MPTREEILKMLEDEDQAEREARERRLALLEQGHAEAEDALRAMRQRWEDEDKATVGARAVELARHEEGARHRDEHRVALGGVSKLITPEALEHKEAQDAWVAEGQAVTVDI